MSAESALEAPLDLLNCVFGQPSARQTSCESREVSIFRFSPGMILDTVDVPQFSLMLRVDGSSGKQIFETFQEDLLGYIAL